MTPAKHEAISILSEESGEVVGIIGKCLRHGLDSHNPLKNVAVTNTELLEHEIGDVLAAIDILIHVGITTRLRIDKCRQAKLGRIGQWLHHIDIGGLVSDR